ncbi:Alpha/beta hydrolase fold-1 [Klenkia terrae]|uniref:alpha/beta fold hydrolase n=1 Tax=Klenkia terrae TaxID=1052259 RepID=UPI00175D2DB3|nr:alpha/beta hydrolase [Klenkia terrae]SSC25256.1 Alpha/beta hydrolase fold-1 [Klenkia terrae]
MMQTLDAPGATLAYGVLGSGPVLVLIGHPMPADGFRALAAELATDRTVVLHDPRGTGASTMADPTELPDPEVLADDLSRVIAAVTDQPVDVFGSSGGGIAALVLASRHPEQVATVVAHEPPLTEYLPDAAELRERLAGVSATHREQGLFPAMGAFMAIAGFAPPAPAADDEDRTAGLGDDGVDGAGWLLYTSDAADDTPCGDLSGRWPRSHKHHHSR